MRIIIAVCLMMLSGCAGINWGKPDRWVIGNEVNSSMSPRLSIKVDESFEYSSDSKRGGFARGAEYPSLRSGQDTYWFNFVDNGNRRRLNIKIENLDSNGRLYFSDYNYAKWPGAIYTNDEKKEGINFETGIIVESKNGLKMVKAFGKAVDDHVRYSIYYIETLDESWRGKNTDILSGVDQDYLAAFNNRANQSFVVKKFSGQRPHLPQDAHALPCAGINCNCIKDSDCVNGLICKDNGDCSPP